MSEEMCDTQEFIDKYHRQMFMKIVFMICCAVGVVLTVGLLSVSTYDGLSLGEVYSLIWNHLTGNNAYEPRSRLWWADRFVWNTTLPRSTIGILAGISLAVAGALMQSLMNNPLADPYSTGISSGACLGAVSAIVASASLNALSGTYFTVTAAFVGALIPAFIIILISSLVRMTPATLILIGTALSYFFNSMVTFLMISTDADTLQSAYLWQVGKLDGMTWDTVWPILIVTTIGSAITLSLYKQLDIMSLGERSAHSLGLDVQNFRTFCLILLSVMTASIVAFTGIIGFIGLVAPHIVRIIVGSDNKYVLPISMMFGSLLLLIADYIAVTYINGVPVGVVMSAIGSPIFLFLIIWQKKGKGAIY